GCSEGALRGRLYRGRELLRARLARRGLVPAALALAAALPEGAVAAPSPALTTATTRAALPFAAGRGAAGPATPVPLTRGVLRALFLDRLKGAAVALVGVAALGAGIAWGVSAAADHRPRAGQATVPLPDPAKKAGPDDWKFPDVNKHDPIYLSRIG